MKVSFLNCIIQVANNPRQMPQVYITLSHWWY